MYNGFRVAGLTTKDKRHGTEKHLLCFQNPTFSINDGNKELLLKCGGRQRKQVVQRIAKECHQVLVGWALRMCRGSYK